MKTKILITTFLFLLPFTGSSQYGRTPQFGAFAHAGLRDYTSGTAKIKSRYGLDVGLNIKHSTRNGVLRMVYAGGFIYDYYQRENISEDRYSNSESKVNGLSILFRPEFRILNKERVSMYIGVGPRFSHFYSFREKATVTENGVTTVQGWENKSYRELSYFGAHISFSVDYKFAEHWALNLGLNAFTGFEFEFFGGNIFSGGNVATGIAYVF